MSSYDYDQMETLIAVLRGLERQMVVMNEYLYGINARLSGIASSIPEPVNIHIDQKDDI